MNLEINLNNEAALSLVLTALIAAIVTLVALAAGCHVASVHMYTSRGYTRTIMPGWNSPQWTKEAK